MTRVGGNRHRKVRSAMAGGMLVVCPHCRQEGLLSQCVQTEGNFTTAMGVRTFYDEQGEFHMHDPNVTTRRYHCSNGHSFQTEHYARCGCGWVGTKAGVE